MVTAFLAQPGLWFLVGQCRGLRSEALTKPASLGPWHALPSPGSLPGGKGEACGAPWGRGSPARRGRPLGHQDPDA